jgi:N-ethylmaleimide reductase
MTNAREPLFQPFKLGTIELPNRIVMASMTRGRATNADLIPTALQVEYYRQRASAGLIISEAVWVSPQSIGFVNVPGLYTDAQLVGWRAVTAAVHAEGGRIFAQIGHSGAASHPDFFDGRLPVAPSAINPGLKSFTPTGFKDTVTPRALSMDEIARTVADYGAAAENAKAAGFDGVELHAQTTYLIPQFLSSALNVRTDRYGGSAENRSRFVLEVMERIVAVWGAGRVGIKLNPTVTDIGGFMATGETVATYEHLVERLNDLPLSHLQLVRAQADLSATPIRAVQDTIAYFRPLYRGTLIANGGFDAASGNAAIGSGMADMISYGAPFIGNPDLVRRLREGLPLTASNRDTYYRGGAEGFVDYTTADQQR